MDASSESEADGPDRPQIDEKPLKTSSENKKELKLVTDTELLARFYGNEAELDHKEKFLRSYILNEGWKEKASHKSAKRERADSGADKNHLLNTR